MVTWKKIMKKFIKISLKLKKLIIFINFPKKKSLRLCLKMNIRK